MPALVTLPATLPPFVGTILLVFVVAAVLFGVRALLRAARESRGCIELSATLAVLAVLPERLGAAGSSIVAGAVVTALGFLLVGLAFRHRGKPGDEPPPPWDRWARRVCLVVGGAMAFVVVTTWLWDETSTHLPLSAAMARGVLPLEHPTFPGQPVHYHIGFDVLAALARAFCGLPLEQCVDVAALACLAAMLWCVHDVAFALTQSRGAAALALFVVPLGYGPLAAILADGWGMRLPGKTFFPAAWVNGATFPPMPVTNFFQHPQGLGMPIACGALLLAVTRPTLSRFALAAALCALSAQAQAVFFAHLGFMLTVVACVHAAQERSLQRLLLRAGMLALALMAALSLGGLVAGGREQASFLVFGVGYFTGSGVVVRELLGFGATLLAPVAALGVWLRRRPPGNSALLLALIAGGAMGFVVANVAHYERSWDIVKFFGVGAFFANFVLVWLLHQLLWHRAWLVALIVTASTWSGGLWLLRYGPLNDTRLAPAGRGGGITDEEDSFIRAYGVLVGPRDRVFAPAPHLARVGVLVPGWDWRKHPDTRGLLIDRDATDRLSNAFAEAQRTLSPASLEILDVRFIALRPPDERRLGPAAKEALRDVTRFERVAPGAIVTPFSLWRVRRPGP